ncbi:hypothetical protein AB0K51_00185 [Kitasatospora sp. NPDC049285]|uniref:hypothetical protein n=1 Tax=Kitasatospora sp. NPDC049285 TaxID=3157096 RepID=UPI003443CBE7
MLNSAWRVAICVLTGIGLSVAALPAANADGGGDVDIHPCASDDICVGVHDPGTPGSTSTPGGGGGGGGDQSCSWNGIPYACWDDDLGWFSSSDGCYYQTAFPQPDATDPAWNGHSSADGAVYDVNCRGADGQLSTKPQTFLAQAPGAAPAETPGSLARSIFADMVPDTPHLHAAPQGNAVVGSAVWLWYDRSTKASGPWPNTVKGQRFTVTVTFTLDHVTWNAGDGSPAFACKDPGTPYDKDAPAGAQSTCSHTFAKSSAGKPDKAFTVTASPTWRVTAHRTDLPGVQIFNFLYTPATISGTMQLPVAEVQALN